MNSIEVSLFEISRLLLWPILLLILGELAFAFLALGAFLVESWQRFCGNYNSALMHYAIGINAPLASDDLELWIMKRLEMLRIASRTAPMLGLVATMIPMGPALLALTKNDGAVVGENLVVAFSAVILTVRRRWLLQELRQFEKQAGQG